MPNQTIMKIQNQGQIKSMELPASWQLLDDYDPHAAQPSYLRYGPGNLANVELYLYFPGRALPGAVQQSIKNILGGPERQLSATEIDSISILLRDASLPGAFSFLNVRSQNWKGKKVLLVEGRWNEIQQDRFWLIVPSNSECETHQEIWFQAPSDVYPAQLRNARQALETICWSE